MGVDLGLEASDLGVSPQFGLDPDVLELQLGRKQVRQAQCALEVDFIQGRLGTTVKRKRAHRPPPLGPGNRDGRFQGAVQWPSVCRLPLFHKARSPVCQHIACKTGGGLADRRAVAVGGHQGRVRAVSVTATAATAVLAKIMRAVASAEARVRPARRWLTVWLAISNALRASMAACRRRCPGFPARRKRGS